MISERIVTETEKSFPQRTEGSVKKHWYKVSHIDTDLRPHTRSQTEQDMHYAEFAEDEVFKFGTLPRSGHYHC